MGESVQGTCAERDARLDNLKALLIYLVVFCHLLANVMTQWDAVPTALYQVVNVFHMPAFVLTTGYFARFKPRRIVWGLLCPYVVFQLLACVWESCADGLPWWSGLTLLWPSWTLWYLLACVFWYASVPLLERARSWRARVFVVVAAFVVSLAVGFVPWIEKFLTLSRCVVFFPFFALGFYAGRANVSQRVSALDGRVRAKLVGACALAVLVLGIPHLMRGPYPHLVLFRSVPYSDSLGLLMRAEVQLAALAWCALLFVAIPSSNRGFFSTIGQNTMSVYLLHTWAIRLIQAVPLMVGAPVVQTLECAVLAVALVALLGNARVGGAFRAIFRPRSFTAGGGGPA